MGFEMAEGGANSRQPGGNHYQAGGAAQHWDLAALYCGYLDGCSSKYVTRWRKKGTPDLDLMKAHHYAEKLLELVQANRVDIGATARGYRSLPEAEFEMFCTANDVHQRERRILWLLFTWADQFELGEAVRLLRQLHEEYLVRGTTDFA